MASMNVRVAAQEDGSFAVEFANGSADQPWTKIEGFATGTAAQEWIRDFMVQMMVAMRPVN